ncbi:MAG: T9SS type A sorting domain-containing protein [Bacteroidia bacterium]
MRTSAIRLSLCFLGLVSVCHAQQITWSEHIAPIVFQHCTPCHRPGEIGPMPFTNYLEASAYASMISFTVQTGYMPPWQPDPNYSSLIGERVLSQQEVQLITNWVQQGALRGDPALEPPLPQFPGGSQLGQPDTVISMAQAYLHAGNNQDMYRVFVLPTNLNENKKIKAIEFRPGNKKIVHHAILGIDLSGQGRIRDSLAPGYGYTQFFGFGFQPTEDNWYGWAPGAAAKYFPANIGKQLPAGADILVQMHYAPSPIAEYDSSSINLFYDRSNEVSRLEQIAFISPQNLTNGPFFIPANAKRTFNGRFRINAEISLLSVFPHSHLIGTDWKVFAVRPGNDTVNLISIPEWDFNWQGFYYFPRLIRLPANSWIYAEASYDNTAANPNNPNSPPQNISWGENTTDEMYLCYFGFVPYEAGDENIVLSDGDARDILKLQTKLYPIYPNPAQDEVTIGFQLNRADKISLSVYDSQGRKLKELRSGLFQPGQHMVKFNAQELSSGVYVISLTTASGSQQQQKLVVR